MRLTSLSKALLAALLSPCPALADSSMPLSTTNQSVTITAGNTFQQILPSAVRRSLTVENNNTSDSCWVYIGPSAPATKSTSILLLSGSAYTRYYPYVPSDAVQATCATTSDTLYVDTQ